MLRKKRIGCKMSLLRKILIALRGKRRYHYTDNVVSHSNLDVQQLIKEYLNSDNPCMIARFGSVELQSVVDYLYPAESRNIIPFLKGKIPSFGYGPSTMRTMHINAGFFPSTDKMLNRFGTLVLDCMKEVDILGSWRAEEEFVLPYLPNVTRVPLYHLEPYYFDNPWMTALDGKRVLVIHPFEDTIRKQYMRLDKLFANKQMIPKYELLTIKAVQSIAGNIPEEFNDWFEALEWMKREIDKKDFDIAIIGCGAYGFPLAAYIKQIGKKAIHLGGAVQYLFGIRSNAAEQNSHLKSIMNECWVYPSQEETPKGIEKVEDSRYWKK